MTESAPARKTISEYGDILESAMDEKPLQEFFTAHPEMLAHQLGPQCRWVIPKPQLGGKYEPDFMAARVNSGGLRWFGIELETPRIERLFTLKHGTESEKLREGLQQVKDWRHWIRHNMQTAQNGPHVGGVGLVGITDQFEGLVLIGRRRNATKDDQRRRQQIHWDQRTDIHSYDWITEQANGLVALSGNRQADGCYECDVYGR